MRVGAWLEEGVDSVDDAEVLVLLAEGAQDSVRRRCRWRSRLTRRRSVDARRARQAVAEGPWGAWPAGGSAGPRGRAGDRRGRGAGRGREGDLHEVGARADVGAGGLSGRGEVGGGLPLAGRALGIGRARAGDGAASERARVSGAGPDTCGAASACDCGPASGRGAVAWESGAVDRRGRAGLRARGVHLGAAGPGRRARHGGAGRAAGWERGPDTGVAGVARDHGPDTDAAARPATAGRRWARRRGRPMRAGRGRERAWRARPGRTSARPRGRATAGRRWAAGRGVRLRAGGGRRGGRRLRAGRGRHGRGVRLRAGGRRHRRGVRLRAARGGGLAGDRLRARRWAAAGRPATAGRTSAGRRRPGARRAQRAGAEADERGPDVGRHGRGLGLRAGHLPGAGLRESRPRMRCGAGASDCGPPTGGDGVAADCGPC